MNTLDWQHPPLFANRAEHEAAQRAHAQSPTPISALWLAWCERESDRAGSQALIQGLGDFAALPAAFQHRLRLIQLEHGLALGMHDAAWQQAPLLLADCLASGDALCAIDTHHHLAGLAEQRANLAARREHLEQAAERARALGDTRRTVLFEANQARMESVLDRPAAEARWGAALPSAPEAVAALSDEVRAAVADFRGLLCGLRAEHAACVRWLQIAFEAAQTTGQVRRAIVAASNLGYFQGQTGAYSEALHWLQTGLALARAHGFPSLTGGLLVHSAEVLRLLGQLDLAEDSLREAFAELQRVPAGRNLCVAHNVKGSIALERGDHPGALAAYETMQALPAIAAADLRGMAGIGRAKALLGLSRVDDALIEIDSALQLLNDQAYTQLQVEALGVRAEALAQLADGAQPAVVVFEQAVALATSLPGHDPDARLLESAARAYAARGEHARALELALQANATRQRQFTRETAQRTSGLRTMHEVERAKADNEHLRRLAEMESSRYELLLRLNDVSQEIICELEAERVYAALERQVHQLLDAQCVAVYVLDDALPQMNFAFGVEMGEAFTDPPIPLDDPNSYCARCVREGAEFVLGGSMLADPRNEIPGTTEMPSMMFMPLRLGPRIVGAMTVQCTRLGAYGEREQLVFRMLCAYGAIALENARAYRRLTELQRHVLTQEKLAALGAMVAGVAHELNTPIGNSLLVASSMREAARELMQSVEAGRAMRRSELLDKVRQVHEGLSVIERGMGSASSLVRSFKQVAVDRSSEKRRVFELREACEHCAQALGVALRRTKLSLQLDVASGLRLDSFPGTLDQVLMILINNAMFHAFEPEAEGRIELGSRLMPNGWVQVWVADDGKGMPPSVVARVFEPFFTTRFGQGGSGLGLSIAHNLVHGILGGRLEVTSTPGVGSRFTLVLPPRTPD